jgi:hypothetical protein
LFFRSPNATTEVLPDDPELRLYPAGLVALWWESIVLTIMNPVLGLIGNFLTVVLLLQPRLKGHPTSQFMIAVAIFDSLSLISATFLQHVPQAYYHRTPRGLACKLSHFLVRFNAESSNMILASMSVERCVAITNPLRARQMQSRTKKALLIIGCMCVVLAYTSYNIWGYNDINGRCTFVFNQYFTPELRYALDYGVFILLPGLILFVTNMIIITSLLRSKSKKLTEGQQDDKGLDQKTRSLIAMLIAASMAFIVLKTPFHIVAVLAPFKTMSFYQESAKLAGLRLAFGITLWMQQANHGINFYLYILTGSEFRGALISLIRRLFCGYKEQTSIDRSKFSNTSRINREIRSTSGNA